MPFTTADDIARVLSFEVLVAALEEAHKGARWVAKDVTIGDPAGKYFVRSTGAPARAFGSKLVTVFPDNESATGLPSVQGLFVLFDGRDGRPSGLIDGTAITYWKTAADSGLGAKLLARPDASSLLMVGAGKLAPWLVKAHLAVRPSIERVAIWNRTPARARDLVGALGRDGIGAEVAQDLPLAASEADVISTATMTREPLIKGAWLRPGTHLDLVGGWSAEMREADDEAATRARIFVDNRGSAFAGAGDILLPIANGAITEADVLADYYDLMAGAEGRRSPRDITLLKNAGGAHLDLMTAETILRRLGGHGGAP